MFVVKVELWPHGNMEKRKEIVKLVGYNNGRADAEGYGFDYPGIVWNDTAGQEIPSDEVINANRLTRFADGFTLPPGTKVEVHDHRRADGMAELIRKMLAEYELIAGHTDTYTKKGGHVDNRTAHLIAIRGLGFDVVG